MALPSHMLFHAWLFITLHFVSSSVQRSTYLVHMNKADMPQAFSSHQHWYASTLQSLGATTTTTKPALLYSYDHAIHGFSASLSPSERIKLKELTGFISVQPDIPAYMETTHTYKFLSLNPDSGLWPASDYGKDVIIGVVDTGIWPESKSFNDDGMTDVPMRWKGECESGSSFNSSMCNRKLIGARFFNKGLIASHPGISINMNSTRDTAGHGTHTSSTASGNYVEGASFFGYGLGTARGMAPRARVAMYKALWDNGAYASDILAAIDSAINDGVDVISLSLGFGRIPLYLDPVAIASFAAVEKGIIVSVAAGNKGPDSATVQHGAPWLLTVGASATDRKFAGTLRLGNGVTIIGMSLFPENAIIQDIPLVYNDTIYDCDSTQKLSQAAKDKIVLCANTRDPTIQIFNLCESEAAGGILITDVTLFLEAGDILCPVVVLSPNSDEVETLMNYLNNNSSNHSVSMKFQQTIYGGRPAPVVSTYTSRGPSMDLPGVLKPDLIAPGSKILAAWPPNVRAAALRTGLALSSDFNLVTGTSMACPHAAGIAALLKGAHPEWSPAAIRSAMMTTATTLDNTSSYIRDMGNNYELATPLAMGAGHVDPNKALDPGLVYDTTSMDYVKFLCSMNYTEEQFLTITRSSTYDCSSSSQDLNYPSFFFAINSNDSTSSQNGMVAREFQREVTNVGDGAATYKANLTLMDGFSVSVTPDVLVFVEKYQKLTFALHMEGGLGEGKIVSYGFLTWVDDGEKHIVRSPIVATNI
ncbi:hypothetical protein IFM89_036185 [Coptis chinensis]|uniref:Subtilisin-like protease SBT1.9 n=1 Tax=Coptis chinensis TaxID=261450 RepID=A0A835MDH0_9MAGN|nr:hypothetical protein IFM89_036185 [Coptis chinensis]